MPDIIDITREESPTDDEYIDIDASGYNLLTAIETALAAGKETT